MASIGSSQVTPEDNFWKWFAKNENVLFDVEKDQDRTFDRLATEMHKIDSNLTFEFGAKQNGHREFVISADGILSAFPNVEALYATAPKLPRWTFIKFRPRRPPSDMRYNGISVKVAGVTATLDAHGGAADITLFIPGYTVAAKDDYTGIAFLLLDQSLGEYDVETRVRQVLVAPIQRAPRNASPFAALPALFDRLLIPR